MHITILKAMSPAAVQEAWRLSRDVTAVTPLEEILKVDAPVTEMSALVLHFEDFMILEREIFTTPRNHVMWARTSRVDDPLQFTVPQEFNRSIDLERYRGRMRLAKVDGAEQDQWRMFLPLAAHTSWVARHSLRDLVKLIKYFDYLAHNGNSAHHLSIRFLTIAAKLTNVVCAVMTHTQFQIMYDAVKLERFMHEGPICIDQYDTGGIGHFKIVQVHVPLALRAQIVRHRPLMFLDNLFSKFKDGWILGQDLSMDIQMQLAATEDFWFAIMAKRNCWIAQADLWAPLSALNISELPCVDGKCPYERDNILRMEGKDPNPPCPLFMDLTGRNAEKDQYRAAMHAHSRTKPAIWRERIEA